MLSPDPKRLFLRYRKKGDAAALGRVFDLVAPELLALAIHVTGDIATAEDAVQDTFLVAVEGAHKYDATRPFVPWLVGILVNRARKGRDRRRDARVRATDDSGAALEEVAATSPLTDPAREVAAREVQDLVRHAVGELHEPYRSVVDQHLTECAPPRDIALTLGRTPGTVRVQLHRGLEQLRALLGRAGTSSARERLSGLGLALPAAAHLGQSVSAQLAGVREVVVQAAVKEASVSAKIIGGSTVNTTLVGLTAAACVLAVAAFRLTAGTDGDASLVAVEPIHIAAVDPRDGELTLAPIQDHERPAVDVRSTAPVKQPTTLESDSTSTKRRAATAGARPEPEATRFFDTYRFYVEPALDLRHVPDIDVVLRAEFSAVSAAGEVLAQTHGPLIGLTQVTIGGFASPDALGPITVRIDHPGALPASVQVLPQDWFALGSDYAVRPTVVLDEIRITARVLADPRARAPFHGSVQLWSFDQAGPHMHDVATLKDADGVRSATLRIPRPDSDWVVFAISDDPHVYAPQMIVFGAPRSGEITLDTRLESRWLPVVDFRIVDPFGDPVSDAIVRGHVIDEAIALRWGPESTPVQIEEWVFCHAFRSSKFVARRDSGGKRVKTRSLRAEILPALRVLEGTREGTREGTGIVRIWGAHEHIYSYTIQTKLNDRPLPGVIDGADGRIGKRGAGPLEVLAPIGALEITAPKEILADKKGPAEWKRARVSVKAGARTIGGSVDASLRSRILVPPSTPLTIEISVPDFGIYEASHPGIQAGTIAIVTPVPIWAKEGTSRKPTATGWPQKPGDDH